MPFLLLVVLLVALAALGFEPWRRFVGHPASLGWRHPVVVSGSEPANDSSSSGYSAILRPICCKLAGARGCSEGESQ